MDTNLLEKRIKNGHLLETNFSIALSQKKKKKNFSIASGCRTDFQIEQKHMRNGKEKVSQKKKKKIKEKGKNELIKRDQRNI